MTLLPVLLKQTLDLVDSGALAAAGVLVIDNDPDAGARHAVRDLRDVRLAYHHEPEPGIASVRNTALRLVKDDLLVFIDDDEMPTQTWLARLVETYQSCRPAAVVGPVVSEFEGALDPWIEAGGFFVRRRLPTGTRTDVAATNNLLLDMQVVRSAGLRFDSAFGLSGGSDTLFTRQLSATGGPLVWNDDAVVIDQVPADRATRRWVVTRAYRMGNHWVRTALAATTSLSERTAIRVRGSVHGIVRVLAGAVRAAFGTVAGSDRHQARGVRTAARGAGMLSAVAGRLHSEYERPSSAPALPAHS